MCAPRSSHSPYSGLAPGRKLMAITPRTDSCNGGCFEPFRRLLLKATVSFERLHVY